MVVYFCWLAACDRHQYCSGIFHNALRVEIWKGPFHKLVGIHDCLLFSEYSRHSATEGEKNVPSSPHLRTSYLTRSSGFPGLLYEKVLNVHFGMSIVLCIYLCSCFLPQVLCLAAFFALVIKKVDEEDFQNVAIVRDDSNTGT